MVNRNDIYARSFLCICVYVIVSELHQFKHNQMKSNKKKTTKLCIMKPQRAQKKTKKNKNRAKYINVFFVCFVYATHSAHGFILNSCMTFKYYEAHNY